MIKLKVYGTLEFTLKKNPDYFISVNSLKELKEVFDRLEKMLVAELIPLYKHNEYGNKICKKDSKNNVIWNPKKGIVHPVSEIEGLASEGILKLKRAYKYGGEHSFELELDSNRRELSVDMVKENVPNYIVDRKRLEGMFIINPFFNYAFENSLDWGATINSVLLARILRNKEESEERRLKRKIWSFDKLNKPA